MEKNTFEIDKLKCSSITSVTAWEILYLRSFINLQLFTIANNS